MPQVLIVRGRSNEKKFGKKRKSKSKLRVHPAIYECPFCIIKDMGRRLVLNYKEERTIRNQMLRVVKILMIQALPDF